VKGFVIEFYWLDCNQISISP